MQTSRKLRLSEYFQSSQPNFEQYSTHFDTHPKPLPAAPQHHRYHPDFQIPRSNSIQSIVESIIEQDFPSPSLWNDPEMYQYISKSCDIDNFNSRVPSLEQSKFPRSTTFYIPSETESVRSSIIKFGEEVLGSGVYNPETRPCTILLPDPPTSYQKRNSNPTISASLKTSSASTSMRTITPELWLSPSKRSATLSQLDHLSTELANLTINHFCYLPSRSRRSTDRAPTTPTPSVAASLLSQASTLTESPPASQSSYGFVPTQPPPRQYHHQYHNMEQRKPSKKRSSRVPQPIITEPSSTTSIRHRTISQPLPSPKLPILLPGPCFDIEPEDPLQGGLPSQSKIDWSDDEDSHPRTRRTLDAIKKAVSHTNLRAASRARSDSANTQKRPPMPFPSPILGQAKANDASSFGLRTPSPPTVEQRQSKHTSLTQRARLSVSAENSALDAKNESPKKLTKKLSMKRPRTDSVIKVEDAETEMTGKNRRVSAATTTSSKKKSGRKATMRRLKVFFARLRC